MCEIPCFYKSIMLEVNIPGKQKSFLPKYSIRHVNQQEQWMK